VNRFLSQLPLLIALAATACGGGDSDDAPEGPVPSVMLHGVRMRLYQGKTLQTLGRAARLAYYRQNGQFQAWEMSMRFPGKGGGAMAPSSGPGPGLQVRAPEAVGNLWTKAAALSGGVSFRSGDGALKGETERARFDGEAMTAQGDTALSVFGPGYRVAAEGFFFRFEDEYFRFEGQVRGAMGGRP
jgi:hypothetical protein